MAKSVAGRWLVDMSKGEYRFSLMGFTTSMDCRKFASLIRSWRDGTAKIATTTHIADLGVQEHGDSIEVWSSDAEGLRKFAKWVESTGLETDFIW